MMADWRPNRDVFVDWPGRWDKAFKPGLSRLKRDVWYAYFETRNFKRSSVDNIRNTKIVNIAW